MHILPPEPEKLLVMLAANTAMFAAIALALWGVEAAWRHFRGEGKKRFFVNKRMKILPALVFTLRKMPWIVAAALAISAAISAIAKSLGLDLPQQDMLQWLAGDTYSAPVKAAIVLFATVEAPFLEEIVFRRFIFRALHRYMALWTAIALSGCVFALVHANILVFIPLAFLGGAFSWLYWRTGRLTAAIFAHFLFNAVNVVLLLTFPEMA